MKRFILSLVSILLLAGSSLSDAGMLYISASSNLYSLTTNGAATNVGQIQSGGANLDIRDIAYDSTSDTMYAITTGSLYTLDFLHPSGGVVTASLVGPTIGVSSLQGLTVAGDGTIYAGSRPSGGVGSLYALSSTNGQVTLVGSFGSGGDDGNYLRDYGDLAFSAGGTLYGTFLWLNHNDNNYLGIVSTSSGTVTTLKATRKGQADGLAFIGDTLYSVSTNKLYTIDPSTGTVLSDIGITAGGVTVTNITGMTYETQVPLPGSLLLLGSGLLSLAGWRRFRRG